MATMAAAVTPTANGTHHAAHSSSGASSSSSTSQPTNGLANGNGTAAMATGAANGNGKQPKNCYVVEHLATFSTNPTGSPPSAAAAGPQNGGGQTTPRMALQRLFAMEKTSGIWTQRMQIQLRGAHLLILDGETADVVERFPAPLITSPVAFNHHNHIYNNILIFTVHQQPATDPSTAPAAAGELHIFQCVSHSAKELVDEISGWIRAAAAASPSVTSSGSGSASSEASSLRGGPHHSNGNHLQQQQQITRNGSRQNGTSSAASTVKETVNQFNQIAAKRGDPLPISFHPPPPPTPQHRDPRDFSPHLPPSSQQHHHPRAPQSTTASSTTSSTTAPRDRDHHHHHYRSSPPQSHHQRPASQSHHGPPTREHFQHSAPRAGDMGLSNERYVSILNHCFDDIERFIIRLQHAAAALRELQVRSHHHRGGQQNGSNKSGGKPGDGLLAIRARGPSEEEFFEILSKFKLAFNLLAKLKGCIHDPNAPELVHFLFTPLAIIVEAARASNPVSVDPTLVGVPYLNPDTLDLLATCSTGKEYDLWQSLGPNWTAPMRASLLPPSRLPTAFQPIFTDGWAPTIVEQDLIGVLGSLSSGSSGEETETDHPHHHQQQQRIQNGGGDESETGSEFDTRDRHRRPPPPPQQQQYDSDFDSDNGHHPGGPTNGALPPLPPPHHRGPMRGSSAAPLPPPPLPPPLPRGHSPASDSLDNDHSPHRHHHQHHHGGVPPPPVPLLYDSAGSLITSEPNEWLADLLSRGAKVVRVLFPRTANNEKELTVVRGEVLEILDDSRKWWRARNWKGHVAHVPHTILEPVTIPLGHPILADRNGGGHHPLPPQQMSPTNEDWIRRERQGKKGEFRYF